MLCNPDLELRRGGFNLPLDALETAGIIRAMNLSRLTLEEAHLGPKAGAGCYLSCRLARDDPPPSVAVRRKNSAPEWARCDSYESAFEQQPGYSATVLGAAARSSLGSSTTAL